MNTENGDYTPPEVGLDEAERKLREEQSQREELDSWHGFMKDAREKTEDELRQAEAGESSYRVIDKRFGREEDYEAKEQRIREIEERRANMSLDLSVLGTQLEEAKSKEGESSDYVEKLKAEEAVFIARVEAA